MSSKSPRQPGWGLHRELGMAKPNRTLPALLQLPPVLQTSRRQHGNKIAEKPTRNRSEVSPSVPSAREWTAEAVNGSLFCFNYGSIVRETRKRGGTRGITLRARVQPRWFVL